ncbi:uncharacterized protein SAPINGB_P006315 [Magnusiomyces paraingens]|uniref:Pentacotripeptide-repeat region of PRORP domain-containing protein n=1 Tax=Magnusiomyces paraingens TaxID=2606893 RepID=A0A5E8C6H7_9ASCO|nr:uncharacterized protein SAPINGB_P006315 [Saprochaete ingens]VVT58650.1 unnamed protein product [Saprochaete ingens]
MLSRSSHILRAGIISRASLFTARSVVGSSSVRTQIAIGYRAASTAPATATTTTAPATSTKAELDGENTASAPKQKRIRSRPRNQSSGFKSKYNGPILSIDEKKAIDAQYDKIYQALNENNLVDASKFFLESYKPEETFLFRNFKQLEGKERLHIKLFHKVLEAHKRNDKLEGVISVSDLYSKYLDGGITVGWMCSEAIIYEISKGRPEQGLELWVKFMESSNNVTNVQNHDNKEAAHSALAAYISSCLKENTEPTSKIALTLVPLKTIPDNTDITRLFRNCNVKLNNNTINKINQGFDTIRYESLDPSNVDFLDNLPIDQPLELENRYAECIKKSADSGVALSESTYARFIFCFAESNRFDRAFEIWKDLVSSGISPSVQSWNMLLKAAALSNKKQVTLIEALLKKMIDSGVKPNSDTYGILINSYFKAGLSDTAVEIYEKLGEENIPVNLYIFNIMLNGLLRSGQEEAARSLLKSGMDVGLSPDIISFNTFITTYIREKKYKEAEKIITLMNDVGVTPNVETYTNIIDTIYKVANKEQIDPHEQIEKIIKSMAEQGIRLSVPTITAIIDGIAKSGNGNSSNLQLYRLMQKKQLRPNIRTFTALINSEILAGDIDRATFFFDEMKQYNVIQATTNYNQLLRALTPRNLIQESMRLFRDLQHSKYASPNVYTYSFVLQCALNTNDMVSATEVLEDLARQPNDFRVGSSLLKILRKLSDRGLKVPIFKDQKQTPYAKKLAEEEV